MTQKDVYIYSNINYPSNLLWTLGLTLNDYEQEDLEMSKINPKLGVRWSVTDFLSIRLAGFRVIKPAHPANQTIQPTQVAGVNQFLDDSDGTESTVYGGGIDVKMSKDLALGFEIVRRNLDEPIISSTLDKTNREEREETFYNLYMNWTPNSDWALSTGFYIDVFDGNPDLRADVPNELVTFGVPINTTYFSSTGVFCGFAANMMYQNLKRPSGVILLDGDDECGIRRVCWVSISPAKRSNQFCGRQCLQQKV